MTVNRKALLKVLLQALDAVDTGLEVNPSTWRTEQLVEKYEGHYYTEAIKASIMLASTTDLTSVPSKCDSCVMVYDYPEIGEVVGFVRAERKE